MNIKKYSQTLSYGLTAITTLIFGFLYAGSDSALDISIHDTYFVISINHLLIVIACFFLFFTFCSWAQEHFNRKPNKILFLLHYLITIIGLLAIGMSLFSISTQTPQRYYQDYSAYDLFEPQSFVESNYNNLFMILLTIGIAQLLFFINIVIALYKNR